MLLSSSLKSQNDVENLYIDRNLINPGVKWEINTEKNISRQQ